MSSDPDGNILLRQVYETSASIIERGGYNTGPYALDPEEVKETHRKAAEALGLPAAVNLRDRIKALEAEVQKLEKQNAKMAQDRLALDARIHNQRKALRVNWQIAEERAGYRPAQSKEVRSRLLAIACRADAKTRALEAENDRLREALATFLAEYVEFVNSGDAGFWDPEKEPKVIASRAALKGQSDE